MSTEICDDYEIIYLLLKYHKAFNLFPFHYQLPHFYYNEEDLYFHDQILIERSICKLRTREPGRDFFKISEQIANIHGRSLENIFLEFKEWLYRERPKTGINNDSDNMI